jgi:hypothetical protein
MVMAYCLIVRVELAACFSASKGLRILLLVFRFKGTETRTMMFWVFFVLEL